MDMVTTPQKREGKILLADDEKTTREILARSLIAHGFDIETASNGFEALEKIQTEPFDLLITDLLMPNMTGTELIEKARQLLPDLVAIVITAHATLETAVKALQQGAYDYITKPFEPEFIIPVIERGLEKSRLRRKKC